MNRIDIDTFNMTVFMITQYDIIHSAGQYENTQQDPDIIIHGFFRSRTVVIVTLVQVVLG